MTASGFPFSGLVICLGQAKKYSDVELEVFTALINLTSEMINDRKVILKRFFMVLDM